jgi:hypothetical protein
MALPSSPIPGVRAVELTEELQPQLQRFYEDNPEYFVAVQGEPAGSSEACKTIHDKPPPGWSTCRWSIGIDRRRRKRGGIKGVRSGDDLLAAGKDRLCAT